MVKTSQCLGVWPSNEGSLKEQLSTSDCRSRRRVTRRCSAALVARCGDDDRCPTSHTLVSLLHHYPAEEAARTATDGPNQLRGTPLADDTPMRLGRSPESRSRSRPQLEATVLDGDSVPNEAILPGAHAHHLWPKKKKIKVSLSNCKIMSQPRKTWPFTLLAGRPLYKFIRAW